MGTKEHNQRIDEIAASAVNLLLERRAARRAGLPVPPWDAWRAKLRESTRLGLVEAAIWKPGQGLALYGTEILDNDD